MLGINSSLEGGPLFGQPTNCRTSNLQRQKILPSFPHQPRHWLDQSHHCSHLDPVSQRLARPKSSPPRPQSTNQKSCPNAVLHSVYVLRNQCSQFVCNYWFYLSLEDHFTRVLDSTQLVKLASAERSQNSSSCCLPLQFPHRSTTHHRIFHLHHLTFHVRVHPFCTISLPIEIVLLVVLDFNAPLTCEPGNEKCARC
jgi:hypothetical protein